MHRATVPKSHFDLGRVDVHIDQRGIDFHEQGVGRLLVSVQHVFVSAACAMHDHLVAHKTAIDIGKLVVRARSGGVGQTGAADHFEGAGVVFHSNGLRHKVFTQHIGQTLRQTGRTGMNAPLFKQLAFVPDGKAHIGAGQGMAAHGFDAVRQFGAVTFQKLAAGRRRKKQLFHFHRGAHGAGSGADLACAAIQCKGIGLAIHAREQSQLGHRIDRCQRFAPEAHGHDRFKLIEVADFAGGVAFQGGGQLVWRNATAIVFNGDQPGATPHQPQRDAARACVHGVVQQFAHHRGGALHHLASGDLADQFIWEFANGAARGSRCV